MPQKILLPIDGSDAALETLQWVSATYAKETTEYYLLYVIHILQELPMANVEVEDALKALDIAREQLGKTGCRVAKSEYVVSGEDAAKVICRCADDLGVDQVVIGSHGRTGLAKLLLGSVSSGVLEHCKKPVLVHRNKARIPAGKA